MAHAQLKPNSPVTQPYSAELKTKLSHLHLRMKVLNTATHNDQQIYMLILVLGTLLQNHEAEGLRLAADNHKLAGNVDSLTARVSRLNTHVRSAGKPIGIQPTIQSFLPGSASKVMVAASFESPRDLIHKLSIRYETGKLLPPEYSRQTKFSEPIATIKASKPKQFERLMQVSRLATKTVLGGMHSQPIEVEQLLEELAPKRARTQRDEFLQEARVLSIVKSHNDSADRKERRMHLSSLVSQFKLKHLLQLDLLPPVTDWLYRQARNHQQVWGAGRPALEIPLTRERLALSTLQAALAFVYDPINIQQVCHCYLP